ncbi:hypothetical protein [Winogradskyella sediminis]|jgi:hypothetical protein|uniref:hypothetical protein n=1 Tax=Winogradskyella sediminis TaxID=1382466 RepID=UPI003AA9C956
MKKKIKSIIVFTLFLTLGFIFLNRIFASQNIFVNVYEDYKSLTKKTNVDILFYGSSHAYTTFNPMIIDDKCKTISYNLGSAALYISLTDLVLKETLKRTKPKLIILEVYEGTVREVISERNKGFQLRALDIIPNYSIEKINSIKNIFSKNEYLGALFPLIRNHEKWNESSFIGFSKRQTLNKNTLFFHSGYRGHFKKLDLTERESFKDLTKINAPLKNGKIYFDEESKKHIKAFINTAKKEGIEVLIVTSPDLTSYKKHQPFFKELKELCKSFSTPYLNLNDYYKEIGLTADDFMDPGHLNIYGGTKTSQFLGEYLNEKYQFSDRSNDESYKLEMQKLQKSKDLFVKSDGFYGIELNKKLIDGLVIKNLSISKNNRDHTITLNIENDKRLDEIFEKYKLSFKIFPTNLDNLNDDSKSKKWKFDKVDIILENQTNPMVFHIFTKIKKIDKAEVFLFNKEVYKGVVGEKITIDDLDF